MWQEPYPKIWTHWWLGLSLLFVLFASTVTTIVLGFIIYYRRSLQQITSIVLAKDGKRLNTQEADALDLILFGVNSSKNPSHYIKTELYSQAFQLGSESLEMVIHWRQLLLHAFYLFLSFCVVMLLIAFYCLWAIILFPGLHIIDMLVVSFLMIGISIKSLRFMKF